MPNFRSPSSSHWEHTITYPSYLVLLAMVPKFSTFPTMTLKFYGPHYNSRQIENSRGRRRDRSLSSRSIYRIPRSISSYILKATRLNRRCSCGPLFYCWRVGGLCGWETIVPVQWCPYNFMGWCRGILLLGVGMLRIESLSATSPQVTTMPLGPALFYGGEILHA